ncbi:alpha/beta hydrolase [Granulicella arctica]|uniref:Alpha-beta hydrolase superfamily lysophospholipase n=1 Tax=Granulicella arctica TaxID=940613 RepID=A0A7Y9TSD0_9BACT|nr:alpha/beta hydrolase [Granulicella arctica]NYF78898.1 alpha-beta hydrolase superfamily lysophospholipase [Granulicella arctica]
MQSKLRSRLLLITSAAVAILFSVAQPLPGQRQKLAKDPTGTPDILHTPTGTVETGTLNNAAYRIDVPANWNHSLVVFYHGYSETPYVYHPPHPLSGQNRPMFDRGYAVIQSGYSTTGWALDQAITETENLRRYFIRKYGQPRETFVAGGSMGGLLTDITLERNPKPYIGGLDLCGAVGPTYESFTRRFADRAAFDSYFPGLLPPLVPPPSSGYPAPSPENEASKRKIADALKDHPAAASAMRNLMSLHSDADVAHMIGYYTFVIADYQHKAGGNPFDNRNYLYTGTNPTSTADDNKLNDTVHRYAADPAARRYLIDHYTPNGRLTKPMLALHTTYDPFIPGTTLALYGHIVEQAGFGDHYVQQYVHRDGHCAISPEEVGIAFDELVTWVHTGKAPTPGLLH